MAERRIVEKTGRGVVSFISNYSWLDGLSFTGMRERYLEAFDAIRIDCLNGDKFKTVRRRRRDCLILQYFRLSITEREFDSARQL